MKETPPSRILIVDDDPTVHDHFEKCLLVPEPKSNLEEMERSLFGSSGRPGRRTPRALELVHALQGQEALDLVAASREEARPFSVAFVDMRIPPGLSGLETIEGIWELDPEIQIVICTAYADRSWQEIRSTLRFPDGYLILKKPFEPIEIQQMATALCEKWSLHRRSEEALASAEELIARRTREIQESSRRLQREIEERARIEVALDQMRGLEALGHVAASLGHEIKNPLAYIESNINFITETVREEAPRLPEELRGELLEALSDTEEGLHHIAEIVNGIKLVGPRKAETTDSVDLHEVVRLSLKLARAQLRGVAKLETALEGSPRVLGSETQLGQIFVNLLVNAAQAMEETTRDQHQLTVRSFVGEAGEAVVEIADTGCGIPPEILEKVRDPYFTTKPDGVGTGLGLAIVQEIVTALGGRLEIESEVEVGTRVRVVLPLDPDELVPLELSA